ncbi:Mur ligase family protein [Microbacterium sp.]|uniref:Mur ligase family protein n=1 Tax=Microbacterium sp. TaxID=51671 RepID=UPI0039E47CAE
MSTMGTGGSARSLDELAAAVPGARVCGSAVVSGISVSTATVQPGDLFAAVRGARTHGALHVGDAIARGAVAVLTDAEGEALVPDAVPRIVVDEPRCRLGALSAWFYGNPAAALTTIGITGTQGKTTTTHLVSAALGHRHAGVIGSMGALIDGEPVASALTTPEAPSLQRMLAQMRERGVTTVAMEASSQGIVQHRTAALQFDVGVMLNLGHDHRDVHGDQESYYAAKRSLLTRASSRQSLVCIDTSVGRRMARDAELDAATLSIVRPEADWFADEVRDTAAGTQFVLRTPTGDRIPFTTPLRGEFHVTDIVAAVAALALVGHDPAEARPGIAAFAGVEGRMQFLDLDPDLTVVIDAGHKPEAINALLVALRKIVTGRLICVIGSNGNRDAHKRPLMGRFAGTASDVVVVTDDNPAHEDPALIRAAVAAGARSTSAEVYDVAGRGPAIRFAVSLARPGDALVVVGKGDERHQIMAHGIVPHSDPDEIVQGLVESPLRAPRAAAGV